MRLPMRVIVATAVLALVATASGVTLWRTGPPAEPPSRETTPSPSGILATQEDDGFARVRSARGLHLPADHAAHREHRTEWWYVNGTLDGGNRRPVGFQLALTRLALAAQPERRTSAWAASTVYFGFLTLSDHARGRSVAHQRMARAALGLAGARMEPTQIWIENWRLDGIGSGEQALDWRLHVVADELELELELHNRKPIIDANELADRGSDRAPPFRFYLQPRMAASGTLRIDGERTHVTGVVAMEHAWGELPLPGGPVARDRFTLFLDDGRELFCIRTHRVDGSGPATVNGLLVDREGRKVVLASADIELEPAAHRVSERSGARYPIRWTLQVPGHGIELTLTPYSEDEEVVVWAPIWAGPVHLRGTSASGRLAGDGFVQLSGYHGPGAQR